MCDKFFVTDVTSIEPPPNESECLVGHFWSAELVSEAENKEFENLPEGDITCF